MSHASRSTEVAEPDRVVVSDVEQRQPGWGRARVTFWVLTVGCALVGAGVVSPWRNPLIGLAVGALVGAVLGTVASVFLVVWPLLRAVWHWLMELVAVAVLVAGGTALAALTGPWWSVGLLAGVGGGVAVVGPLRRRLRALVWCAIVRHRLRACFAAFIRARNRVHPGLAPLILLARPTPAGERVWVWLRTGLDAGELESRTGKIAVACWASDVQVSTSRRFAALVRLDVARRDPLRRVISSPLARAVPDQRTASAPVGIDVTALALDLDDVTEESVTERPSSSRGRSGPAAIPVPRSDSEGRAA